MTRSAQPRPGYTGLRISLLAVGGLFVVGTSAALSGNDPGLTASQQSQTSTVTRPPEPETAGITAPERTVTVSVPAPPPGTVTKTITVTEQAPAQQSIGPGTHTVPDQITPGVYTTAGPDALLPNCHWARLTAATAEHAHTSGNPLGSATVTVTASDKAFQTSGCQPWVKVR